VHDKFELVEPEGLGNHSLLVTDVVSGGFAHGIIQEMESLLNLAQLFPSSRMDVLSDHWEKFSERETGA